MFPYCVILKVYDCVADLDEINTLHLVQLPLFLSIDSENYYWASARAFLGQCICIVLKAPAMYSTFNEISNFVFIIAGIIKIVLLLHAL